jgi:hypothetical protein
MDRRASVVFLGLFAVSAALQGAAACSNSGTTPTPPGSDSGSPPTPDASPVSEDSGDATSAPQGCTGVVPIMTVAGPNGTQIAPDWSCYAPDASFLFRPRPFDTEGGAEAGDDGGEDAAVLDAGTDAPPVDAAPPPPDASVPDSAPPPDASSNDYVLSLTDFVTSAPPVGASVDIIWGGSTLSTPAFTGTVDDGGLLFFPPPPAGQQLMTYHLTGAGEAPLYWTSVVIVPPPGRTVFQSLLNSSRTVLIQSILGSQQPSANLSLVVTGAEDCQYRDVTGAQFQMIDTTTGQPVKTGTAQDDPRSFYLENNLPNTLCTYSSNQGRSVWAMINAPADTKGRYVLQFSGRMGDGPPVVIDQYPVESYAGTVSVMRSSRLNVNPPH